MPLTDTEIKEQAAGEELRRHREEVLARDGYRCRVPECTALKRRKRSVAVHHPYPGRSAVDDHPRPGLSRKGHSNALLRPLVAKTADCAVERTTTHCAPEDADFRPDQPFALPMSLLSEQD